MAARRWGIAVIAAVALSAGAMALTTNAKMTETLILDIQAGEPIGDALARSTMQIDLTIPLGLQGVPLPELADWNGLRYQLRLRGGDDRSALIPWTPVSGTIWLHSGVISEIDLSFANPHKTRADAPDWLPPLETLEQPPASPDQVADALIAMHDAIQSLTPRPVDTVSCAENLPVTTSGNCTGVTVMADPLTPDAIRQAVTELQTGYGAALAHDPTLLNALAPRLVLGQWWLPNGNLVMLSATASLDTAPDSVPLTDRPVGAFIDLNVKEFFNANLGLLMQSCYDQQAIVPQKIAFTPAQAAQIFRGLLADFYPPNVDGRTVTDMIELQQLDWARLTDAYWNDAETRRGFCALLEELQQSAGYTGPVAPRR